MEVYVVHVTKRCNLWCFYCYEQDKESVYTWDEVKGFIDELLKMRTTDTFIIEFLGGEPMLTFDLVEKAYTYLESIEGINIPRYIITTNGTILTCEIVEFLTRNPKVGFSISLDGSLIANQLRVFKDTRVNSYSAVMKNIKRLLEVGYEPAVHMVTHPFNVHLMLPSVRDLYKNGLRYIDFGIVESTMTIDESFASLYIDQARQVSDRIHSGEFEDLHIGVFESLKPIDDERTYIRDKKTGKLIGESYGRAGDDVSRSDQYEIVRITEKSETTRLIDYMREEVYKYHNNNKEGL